ncbi:glycosyltransferase domain-containing protein [Falsirhodobacter xinxiangensis]|uniref:glycosyltransferase domain-containing protein n=1 Tax=Falsirhodobacter xinxiangensis TaxID=2530049 RepID=UPI00145B7E1F|nr:glycosyltransferase domain-containing protein [Rhodobacter xinxiangensis]
MSRSEPVRVVVFTVIVAGYDRPMPILCREPGIAYCLVSDTAFPGSDWDHRPIPEAARMLDPVAMSRWCKFFGHLIFPEYDLSIYLDGNLAVIGPVRALAETFRQTGATMGLFAHRRKTIEAEVEACVHHRKFSGRDRAVVAAQVERYRADGILLQEALTDNGVLFRNHRAPELDNAMRLWWREFAMGVRRDQVSLPYIRKATRMNCVVWPWNYRADKARFAGPFPHFGRIAPRRFSALRYDLMVRRKILRQILRRRVAQLRHFLRRPLHLDQSASQLRKTGP